MPAIWPACGGATEPWGPDAADPVAPCPAVDVAAPAPPGPRAAEGHTNLVGMTAAAAADDVDAAIGPAEAPEAAR